MQIYLTKQQNISHKATKYISHSNANISHTAMQIYLTQQCKYISHSNANISHTAMQIYLT